MSGCALIPGLPGSLLTCLKQQERAGGSGGRPRVVHSVCFVVANLMLHVQVT